MRKRRNNFRTRSTNFFRSLLIYIGSVIVIDVGSRVILGFMKHSIDSGLDNCIHFFSFIAGAILAIVVDFFWKAYDLKKKYHISYADAIEMQKERFMSWL